MVTPALDARNDVVDGESAEGNWTPGLKVGEVG